MNKQSRILRQWNSSSEDQISVGRVHIQTMTAIHGRGQLTAVVFKAEKKATGNLTSIPANNASFSVSSRSFPVN